MKKYDVLVEISYSVLYEDIEADSIEEAEEKAKEMAENGVDSDIWGEGETAVDVSWEAEEDDREKYWDLRDL
mgnify:CR=1 FL=1